MIPVFGKTERNYNGMNPTGVGLKHYQNRHQKRNNLGMNQTSVRIETLSVGLSTAFSALD